MLNYSVFGEENGIPLVVCHGFTGSGDSFNHLSIPGVKVYAIHWPGHDGNKVEVFPSWDEHLSLLHRFITTVIKKPVVLLGYSMGGRLSLGYALKYPEMIEKLILESTSPGLEEGREARKKADVALADSMEEKGLDWFLAYWENIPLFASMEEKHKRMMSKERAQHTVEGLAHSLRKVGTGVQPSYWDILSNFHRSVWIIVGEKDRKFVEIGERMHRRFLHSTLIKISAVGHVPHVEDSEKFGTIVEDIVKEEL